MNNDSKFHIKFKISGIGPLNMTFPFELDQDIGKAIIYAPNGSGKTFVSRCFALLDGINSTPYEVSQLVSFSQEMGFYNFSYNSPHGISSSIKYTIDKNGKIQFSSNKNNLIFYVFNSDYVKKNFYEKNYHPDGNIPGMITIGEENIKIQKKREELKQLEQVKQLKQDELKQIITNKKKEISQKFNMGATLQELKLLDIDVLLNHEGNILNANDNLDTLFQKFMELKDLEENPDKYSSIRQLEHHLNLLAYDEEFEKILGTVYTKTNIQTEFLSIITRDQEFIKTGLALKKGSNLCPFCGQSLDNVQNLIKAYQDFFDKTQQTVEEQIERRRQVLRTFKHEIIGIQHSFPVLLEQFNGQKDLFNETKELVIKNFILPASFNDLYEDILNQLDKKTKDITQRIDLHIQYMTLNSQIQNILDSVDNLNNAIKTLEKSKENITSEIRSLKRKVCELVFDNLLRDNKKLLQEIKENIQKQKELKVEINDCVSQKPKKEYVHDIFTKYVNKYFGGKYKIDKDDFEISLEQYKLENPALSLSDGEKTVISFCYYLANIYSVVQEKDDCQRLFLIIDDPISSLDYNFVYITTTLIKNLEKELGIKTKIPMIILTHHIDFMNLLCSNNIIRQAYILKHNGIKKSSNNFIVPHFQHLYDIYQMAQGNVEAKHTIPNSIRQVLEYINNFKDNTLPLVDFIRTEKIFQDESMLLLIHNLSHGHYKTSPDLIEEQLSKGCNDVINYIEQNFPGQIKQLKK